MVTATLLNHIRNQLCSDRRAAFILLVLPSVGEKRYDSSDPFSTGNLAGVDHDTELHERCVDRLAGATAASVDNVDIAFAY